MLGSKAMPDMTFRIIRGFDIIQWHSSITKGYIALENVK